MHNANRCEHHSKHGQDTRYGPAAPDRFTPFFPYAVNIVLRNPSGSSIHMRTSIMLMRIPVDLCYFRLHDARILNTAEAVSFTSGLSRTERNRLAVIFILLHSIHHPFLSGKRDDAKKRHENDEHEYNSTRGAPESTSPSPRPSQATTGRPVSMPSTAALPKDSPKEGARTTSAASNRGRVGLT